MANTDNVLELRLLVFLGVLLTVWLAEWIVPRRKKLKNWMPRQVNNLLLTAINTFSLRVAFPITAVGLGVYMREQNVGLFNWVNAPYWIEVLITVVILDLVIYWQHVLFHRAPILWRLHKVHHADPFYDTTTGIRFHTFEILLSMVIKMGCIVALGASAGAIIIFEMILSSLALFNHGNIRLPLGIDKVLRIFIVTPDMHRVHHSQIPKETDSNFGFNLSVWDRLFCTYIPQPEKGHEGMDIGLSQMSDRPDSVTLLGMLKMPFGK